MGPRQAGSAISFPFSPTLASVRWEIITHALMLPNLVQAAQQALQDSFPVLWAELEKRAWVVVKGDELSNW